jgi:hypothetical protein
MTQRTAYISLMVICSAWAVLPQPALSDERWGMTWPEGYFDKSDAAARHLKLTMDDLLNRAPRLK